MITLNDIIDGLQIEKESNVYYYDSLNEVGYHLHLDYLGRPVAFMKNTGRRISKISEKEFVEAVNHECFENAISEDGYYEIGK